MTTKMFPVAIVGLALNAGLVQAGGYIDQPAHTLHENGRLLESTVQAHSYRKSISGPAGCSMPAESDNPDAGDCILELGSFETGTWIFQGGEGCTSVAVELEKMEQLNMGEGKVIDLPLLSTTTETVDCPT
jgi:hypothetical protein